MSKLQANTAKERLPQRLAGENDSDGCEDEAFVAQVKERFERDFLPRFGPLWRSMLQEEDKENDRTKFIIMDIENPKVPPRSIDFLDAIGGKQAVTFTVGSSHHDEDCLCGCEPPVLEEDVLNDESSGFEDDNISTNGSSFGSPSDAVENDDKDDDVILSNEGIKRKKNDDDDSQSMGSEINEDSTNDDDCESMGSESNEDSTFDFGELRNHLPTKSGSRASGKPKRRIQLEDSDDAGGESLVTSSDEDEIELENDTDHESDSDGEQDVIDLISSESEESDSDMQKKRRNPSIGRKNGAMKSARKPSRSGASFSKCRELLTKTTFDEFNQKAFGGRLAAVDVVWNKKLKTTAGLTRLRRCKANMTPGFPLKRLACIELSTKVVDSEERLRSTLLHELVHAIVWIVDGIDKPPHGPNFKKWARTAMSRIPDVKVTTTHSYEIDYKYVWKCSNSACSSTVKRHSKSFDISKYRCGKCKGNFVTAHSFGSSSRNKSQPSAYNTFVKEQAKVVRETLIQDQRKRGMQNPKVAPADVMKECARLWREQREIEAKK
jgi:predicted SprT family Zn-dependent metalloprotease